MGREDEEEWRARAQGSGKPVNSWKMSPISENGRMWR